MQCMRRVENISGVRERGGNCSRKEAYIQGGMGKSFQGSREYSFVAI